MSLLDVEVASGGEIKAVVLGSYERGSRSLSVKRAIQLADFYGIPVHHLFGSSLNSEPQNPQRLAIDLRRVREFTASNGHNDLGTFGLFTRFIGHMQNLREDWNGEILSLRREDFDYLAIILGTEKKDLYTWIVEKKLIFFSER